MAETRLTPFRFGVSQVCLILCALGLGAISISSLPMMVIGTLIMGIGYGPVTPASSHLLVRTTPFSMMSTVFSIEGMATGGTLFFTFLGILLGLPAFSLVVETTGSYPLGFVIVAVATLACGVVLSFSRTPR